MPQPAGWLQHAITGTLSTGKLKTCRHGGTARIVPNTTGGVPFCSLQVKLAQSSMTPMTRPEQEVVFESGKGFRLGIMLNDNDVPGWDDLNPVVWPSTYGTFERPDRLAPAVFE